MAGPGMGGPGGGGGGQNGGKGGGRSSAAQLRLAEKLRLKREAADGNVPEVRGVGVFAFPVVSDFCRAALQEHRALSARRRCARRLPLRAAFARPYARYILSSPSRAWWVEFLRHIFR
jgi:hypothetical protein